MTSPAPRYDDSIDFLRRWRPGGPWLLTAIGLDKTGIETRAYRPGQEAELRNWLEQQGASRNIYYSVNVPFAAYVERFGSGNAKKTEATDIEAMVCLHVDLDPREGEDITTERARILARLTTNLPPGVPPPTLVVFSGGGYQGFWKLREPVQLDGSKVAADDAKRWNLQLEVVFGADHCHNIDRILRLPGTVNRPDSKKKAKGRIEALAEVVEWHPERVYDIGQFTKAPEVQAAGAKDVGAAGVAQRVKVSGNVRRYNGDIDAVPGSDKLPPKARVVIVQGLDPDEPNRFGGSRSEWLLFACCAMVRAGFDDDTIYAVITDPAFGISASVLDKGSATEKYAIRQIARARESVADFATDDKGRPFPIQANIRIALAKLGVVVEHDDFSDRDFVRGLDGFGPYLDDKAVTRLRLAIDEQFNLRIQKDFFYDVVTDMALANRRHPVREYLAGLCWDGTPRLDTWLSVYASAEDSEYTRAVGALVLVAAVRRVRQPGCKFDEMLVLEGPQGKGKSSLLATLAVREDWFSDDLPLNADTKRQMEALAGRWIVEAGELKGMRKGDAEALKSFLSRRVDRARMAYGRAPTELPRQCVIVGTTNSDKYLKDTTGNRRFWPVRTGDLRLAELARDRDQLWAEAAVREAAGAPIRLDPSLYAAAADAQEDRLVGDPFMEDLQPLLGEVVGKIRTADVWKLVGKADSGRRTQDDANRLGEVMRRLGWERKYRRIGGESQYVYLRGTAEEREKALTVEGQEGRWRVVELVPGRTGEDYRRAAAEPEIPF